MVKDIVDNTKNNLKTQGIKNINDVYKSKIKLVNFSKKMSYFDYEIKKFLKKNMYFNKKVLNPTKKGTKVIKFLFKKIKRNPLKYIKKQDFLKRNVERCVCDFIAGMTDRYAINLFNSIK